MAGSPLATVTPLRPARKRRLSQKSNSTLQSPPSFGRVPIRPSEFGAIDADANFQNCQFDPGLGRGADPVACEGSNSGGADYGGSGGPDESRSPEVHKAPITSPDGHEIDVSQLSDVFQSFGIKDAGDKKKVLGVRFGHISGHQLVPRLKTRKNWWIFQADALRMFLFELAEGPRDGERVARKAAVVLYHYYYFRLLDEEIFREHRDLFKNVSAAKTFRQEIFQKGCQQFGEGEEAFGCWHGRQDDPSWIQFRKEQEQREHQRLEENEVVKNEAANEEVVINT